MTDLKGKYVIARAYSAGVFAGILDQREGKEVELTDVRRLWFWSGAASLSEMAVKGVKNPGACKFSVAVDRELLLEAIEILPTSAAAEASIRGVAVWEA